MGSKYEKLFKPGKIGKVQLKNRIVRTGAGTFNAKDNRVTQSNLNFYEALAKGGTGLITVEGIFLNYKTGPYPPSSLRLDDDKYIPDLKSVTDIIHKYDSKAFLQMLHLGTWDFPIPGLETLVPISSSTLTAEEIPDLEAPFFKPACARGLEISEIKEVADGFAQMAERAFRAGFDGVEINAAGSHFLNSFLSLVWNKRQDEYGCQSYENRARMITDIIKAIKAKVGSDFPVIVVFNGKESGVGEKGTKIEDAVEFAKIFEAAGADALHVRCYGYGDKSTRQWIENTYYPELIANLPPELNWKGKGAGAYLPVSEAIKKVVNIPVVVVGRMDIDLGESALEKGQADFIAFQRRLIADPEMPNKAAAGRTEDIAPCTACLYCASGIALDKLTCRINAAIGEEGNYQIKPASQKKKVVVVGGGPAGMEAARVAALRGHDVTLFEKESKLGGILPLAALVKGTEIEDLPALINYLQTQVTKLGVTIKTKTEFKADMVDKIKPDVVIIAAGGTNTVPEIKGSNKKIVVSGPSLHKLLKKFLKVMNADTMRNLTKLYMPLGKRVVILGGAIHGAELAEFLVLRNHQVTIVDTCGPMEIGKGISGIKQFYLNMWMMIKGVKVVTEIQKIEEITDKGVVIINKDGEKQLLEADSVATAMPLQPNMDLYNAIQGKVPEVYAIGDCNEGGLIIDAVAQGHKAASNI